jgi:hypothetical protein
MPAAEPIRRSPTTSARCGSMKNIASFQSDPSTTIAWTPAGRSTFSSGRQSVALYRASTASTLRSCQWTVSST